MDDCDHEEQYDAEEWECDSDNVEPISEFTWKYESGINRDVMFKDNENLCSIKDAVEQQLNNYQRQISIDKFMKTKEDSISNYSYFTDKIIGGSWRDKLRYKYKAVLLKRIMDFEVIDIDVGKLQPSSINIIVDKQIVKEILINNILFFGLLFIFLL